MKIRKFNCVVLLVSTVLFLPAFVYGVAVIWAIAYLLMVVHLTRALCQFSLRSYEDRLSYSNEGPKIKWIVFALCTYLSLPFLAYILIMGDLNAFVSSGLDRAVIMILPLEVMKLPIEDDPTVIQVLLLQQLLLSFFGLGGGMLYARKEITAISLPDLPKNSPWRDDASKEETIRHNSLWGSYYFICGIVSLPVIFIVPAAISFFTRFWTDSHIHLWERVLVLPYIFFMPYAMFSVFFAIAFNCIARSRMS